MTNAEKQMLVVDDEIHLRKMVITYAEVDGFTCQEADNGQQAIKLVEQTDFDIIILDVMMPGMDGFETLTKIRKISQVPVIMLTARSEEYDKLFGFNLGADDYVVKPFSPKELMARVKAVLKRNNNNSAPAETYQYGALFLEPRKRLVQVDGVSVSLPPKEYELLLRMVENENIVLTRDQLLEKVWGYDYYGDTRTLDTHIKSLRDHLGSCRQCIKTVWGVGYKFQYEE